MCSFFCEKYNIINSQLKDMDKLCNVKALHTVDLSTPILATRGHSGSHYQTGDQVVVKQLETPPVVTKRVNIDSLVKYFIRQGTVSPTET